MENRKIGILVGSARKGSYSGQVARAVAAQLPEHMTPMFLELEHLPIFNQDCEEEGATPQSYIDFREALKSCDGFLFVTPEHNRSLPALLKNAIDIGSRPGGQNCWSKKPAAIISCSPGKLAGIVVGYHLRQVMSLLNAYVLPQPEVALGDVHTLISADGGWTSESTAKFIGTFTRSFDRWVERFSE